MIMFQYTHNLIHTFQQMLRERERRGERERKRESGREGERERGEWEEGGREREGE